MGGLFNYDGPVMQFLNKVFDVMLVGILWLIGCLPVITVGASTTAMYTVLLKLVKNGEYTVLKTFWKAFKDNFKQATLIWLIFAAVILVLGVDAGLLWWLGGDWVWKIVLVIFLLFLALALGMFVYVFPLQAYFENTIKNTIRNSFLLSVAHLPKTILMLAISIAVLALILISMYPLLLLFGGVLAAYPNAWFLNKIFAKYVTEPSTEEIDQDK